MDSLAERCLPSVNHENLKQITGGPAPLPQGQASRSPNQPSVQAIPYAAGASLHLSGRLNALTRPIRRKP